MKNLIILLTFVMNCAKFSNNLALGNKEKNNNNLLIELLEKKDIEQFLDLVKQGADINHIGKGDCTPLIHACSEGDQDLIKLLLDMGANINAQNNGGATALAIAAHERNVKVVEMLLDRGADPNIEDYYGCTPLLAVSRTNKPGSLEISKLLLPKTEKIDTKDGYYMQRTVLMYACMHGWKEIVKALLERGVDINYKDKTRRSALNYVGASIKLINQGLENAESEYIKYREIACLIIKSMKDEFIKLLTSLNKNPNIETHIKNDVKERINLLHNLLILPQDILAYTISKV